MFIFIFFFAFVICAEVLLDMYLGKVILPLLIIYIFDFITGYFFLNSRPSRFIVNSDFIFLDYYLHYLQILHQLNNKEI